MARPKNDKSTKKNKVKTSPPERSRPKTVSRDRLRAESKALELEVYRTLGGLASRRTPRATLFARFLDIALKGLSGTSGAIFLLDNPGSSLRAEAIEGCSDKTYRDIARLTVKSGRSQHKRVRAAKDNRNSKDRAATVQNVLSVPIKLKGDLLGAIALTTLGATPLEADTELKRLFTLAKHFSTILARAEIFYELDNRISQLSALHDIGSLLTSTLDQNLVRHMTIEALTKLMRTETGSLLLVDDKTDELYFEVALGAKGEKIKRIRLGMGEGIAGWVAKHDSPVIISDVMKDDRFQSTFDHKSKFRTRNMICVPVKIHGRVIGVIQAINRIGGASFTQDDLKLFGLFANQVAIALDNSRLYGKLRDTFYATSEALAEAIEKRDPYTGGHTKRVLKYSLAIADELGLDAETTETLKLSAVLHDIGKIGIADSILRKDAPLNDAEARIMQSHPKLGVEIIKHVPHLSEVIPGIHHHHERIDGHGYPEGTTEIPLVARIISVADTFDAITTTRPYRKGLPVDSALKELKDNKGKQFDPPVVNAFVRAHKKGKIGKKALKRT